MHKLHYIQNLHKENRFAHLARRLMHKYHLKRLASKMRIETNAPGYPWGYPQYGY